LEFERRWSEVSVIGDNEDDVEEALKTSISLRRYHLIGSYKWVNEAFGNRHFSPWGTVWDP